jgi:uncharacterized membrane protein YgcG
MKTRFAFVFSLLSALLFSVTGCVTHAPRTSEFRTYMLIVSVQGEPPTPVQLSMARDKAAAILAPRGWTLVDDPTTAQVILRAEFIPDPTNPDQGATRFISMITNPRAIRPMYARSSATYRTSDPFTLSNYPGVPYEYRNDSYDYSSSGGYGSGTLVAPQKPPHNPDDTHKTPPPAYHRPPHDDSGRFRYQPDDNSGYSSSRGSSSDSSYSGSSNSSSSSSSSSFDSGSSSGGSSFSSSSDSGSSSGPSSGGGTAPTGHSAEAN